MSYEKQRLLAERLINKKGRKNIKVVRPGVAAATDPSMPWKLDGTASDTIVGSGLTGTVFSAERNRLGEALVPGTTARIILAASDLTKVPEAGDRVEVGKTKYVVVVVRTLQPGDDPITHTLHVREI